MSSYLCHSEEEQCSEVSEDESDKTYPERDQHTEFEFPILWGEPPAVVREILTEAHHEGLATGCAEEIETIIEHWKLELCRVLYDAKVLAPVSEEFSSHYYAAHISEKYSTSSDLSLEEAASQYPKAKSPFLEAYNAYWIERDIWSDCSLKIRNSKHKLAVDAVVALQTDQQVLAITYDDFVVQAKRMRSAAKVAQRQAKILDTEIQTARAENADLAAKITTLKTVCRELEAYTTCNEDNDKAAVELEETKLQLAKTQRLVKMLLPLVLDNDKTCDSVVSDLLKRKLDPSYDEDSEDEFKRMKTK